MEKLDEFGREVVRTDNIKVFFKLQRRNPAKNFIGKPYAGKPHVRIDEGVGKEFFSFPLYSTVKSDSYQFVLIRVN